MDERVNIEVSGDDLDLILKYMKCCGADTVQDAIMSAVGFAYASFDDGM